MSKLDKLKQQVARETIRESILTKIQKTRDDSLLINMYLEYHREDMYVRDLKGPKINSTDKSSTQ